MAWWLILVMLWPLAAGAELVWLPDAEPQAVFASTPQPIKAAIRNTGDTREQRPVQARLCQTGSDIMAPVGKAWLWKDLVVLPGQTVLEEIQVKFPKVEAETPFRLFWLDEKGVTLAFTDVRAYPDHLLSPLIELGGRHPLGVFDPGNRLIPLMRAEEIDFQELTPDGHPEAFKGRLVILMPVEGTDRLPDHFARNLCAVARERGLALVWFQSPDKRRSGEPAVALPVPLGKGRAILAPASLLTALATSPKAQLNLVWLAGLAVEGGKSADALLNQPRDDHKP